ncbi:hypothetical protein [Candidatus Nitrotoga arctica]|uniref:Lipoprotein n=1 Tax=Candidatus Nitrotoga arctica TaxID=453162 RepID=A0ABN8ASK2_9PROT|nr:hypothetical protein [Candidatus Nitrotoga arctica]CAG9933403.1 exported protein of unknown function [Candidatus Nitrotoga arctica]
MRTFFRLSIFAGALCVISTAYATAADDGIVPSYTMEEIYERAAALKQVLSKDKTPNDPTALLELAMKAAEFRGYVAGILDLQAAYPKLVECSKRNSIGLIAARTAGMVTSVPLDRGGHPSYNILLSIYFACDESNWTKKNK